jgi:hypothetical protein
VRIAWAKATAVCRVRLSGVAIQTAFLGRSEARAWKAPASEVSQSTSFWP